MNVAHEQDTYPDSDGSSGWSTQQYIKIMELRQNAVDEARRTWADYIFFVDCDYFLFNPLTLRSLVSENRTVISPMMNLFNKESGYSNFWGAMDEQGYYKRSSDYFSILKREQVGCFEVPMVHSVVLINLRKKESDHLRYFPSPPRYEGELDDILVFAYSARVAGIRMYILNRDFYGRMLPVNSFDNTLADDKMAFKDEKIEWIAYNKPLVVSKHIVITPPPIDNMMFDKVFLINLRRRKDRRDKMLASFAELGFSPTISEAVDGRKLTPEKLQELGVEPLDGFKDPYWGRPLTMGEVGCFLSHYNIWKQMVTEGIELVLVLEDDVRFQPNFKWKLERLMNTSLNLLPTSPWDMIYVGRKVMHSGSEPFVEGSADDIVWAQYSYWTLGYVLRLSGAKKLIADNPLRNMIPVDEYIPVKFNSHTDAKLLQSYAKRDVLAWSAKPLLIYPTHYVGEEGYISDTEATVTIHNELPVSAKGVDILSSLNQNSIPYDDSHVEL